MTDPTNQQGETMSELTHQRLEVNINDETAALLRRYKSAHGVTATEAVRRAIGILLCVDDVTRNGDACRITRTGDQYFARPAD